MMKMMIVTKTLKL